jgi:hypothetical protein
MDLQRLTIGIICILVHNTVLYNRGDANRNGT